MTLNLAWQRYRAVEDGAPGGVSQNIARGYYTAATNMLRELRKIEHVHVVDVAPGETSHPKVAVHFCPAHVFAPIRGKKNVVFSMWEGGALDPNAAGRLALADCCIVPSRFCANVWERHGLSAERIPLGLTEAFLSVDTSRPILVSNRTLRFLWLGSRLERKGWQFLADAWFQAFTRQDRAELYVKTSGEGTLEQHFDGAVTVDNRDLPEAELVELYQSADVFVFPTMGEGFGLPALEAMASGCLVLAPEITGLTEFVNGYTALRLELGEEVSVNYGGNYRARFPTVEGLSRSMRRAYEDWGRPYLESIRRTGAHNAKKFTWRSSAEDLASVLLRLAGKAAA